MVTLLKLYATSLVIFFVLDMIWLGWLARGFYQRQIGPWMAPQVNWTAAILFYLLFLVGLLYFAIWPALQTGSASRALLNGAFFGLVTYATYELTNLATHRDWPTAVVLVDMAWGTVLCAAISWGTFMMGRGWGVA